ncbi:hypothetical protein RB594_009584 [Gaeumannomyces avenae]
MTFSVPRCVLAALAATPAVAQAAATAAAASLPPSQLLMPRNQCMEGADKICYGIDGGQSQNLDVEMVQLRGPVPPLPWETERQKAPRATPCPPSEPARAATRNGHRALPKGTGIRLLVKHTDPSITSSVTYEDMADSVDGGEDATDSKHEAAVLGCGANEGQRRVVAKSSNPAYQTPEYKDTGANSEGIVIKLIGAPDREVDVCFSRAMPLKM